MPDQAGPLADFTLAVEFDKPREVRVIVYRSPAGLRIAATRHDNARSGRSRRRRNANPDTLGICHRFEWLDATTGESDPLCAIVRFAAPNLGVGIISHELAHAAVWMRELTEPGAPLTCANDERFCWVLGELVRQTINAMNERGIFDGDVADPL